MHLARFLPLFGVQTQSCRNSLHQFNSEGDSSACATAVTTTKITKNSKAVQNSVRRASTWPPFGLPAIVDFGPWLAAATSCRDFCRCRRSPSSCHHFHSKECSRSQRFSTTKTPSHASCSSSSRRHSRVYDRFASYATTCDCTRRRRCQCPPASSNEKMPIEREATRPPSDSCELACVRTAADCCDFVGSSTSTWDWRPRSSCRAC